MIRQEVAAACFRSRPRRPPQPKRFSLDPSPGLPPSIRPRRSPRTCPTTPADFRAPPNARPSNPHSPSPLAVAISAARGFLPTEAFTRRPFSPRLRFCAGPASATLNDSSRPVCANSGHWPPRQMGQIVPGSPSISNPGCPFGVCRTLLEPRGEFAASFDAPRLRRADPFHLTLVAQVGLELSKDACVML